jgi:CheY-like chemotaxis protein
MSAMAKQKRISNREPAATGLATYPKQTQEPKKESTTPAAVLIADADPFNLARLRTLIEKEGFTVLVASDGREARKILQTGSDFIAAIFKAVIPHVSGPDLVRYMRRDEHLRNIPVIMMTQTDSIRILCESFAAGAAVLLPEPFSTSQIQNLFHMLVDPRNQAVAH